MSLESVLVTKSRTRSMSSSSSSKNRVSVACALAFPCGLRGDKVSENCASDFGGVNLSAPASSPSAASSSRDATIAFRTFFRALYLT